MATVDSHAIIESGNVIVEGRLVDASNATLFTRIELDSQSVAAIYKPVAGERPLWDFSEGCLAHREYASFVLSQYLEFNVVPFTVLRDGPFGLGMFQEWIEIDESIDLGEFFSSDSNELRGMALFDAIINNTDRKIGHLLPTSSGKVFGCDHGVTFHVDNKLRTVLWQWAGDTFNPAEIAVLERAAIALETDLAEKLSLYLTDDEIKATLRRVQQLLLEGTFPLPNPNWPSIPWPAF